MNANHFNQKWMEFKGELKQRWGKFTHEDLQQIEGFLDSFIVKAQERYGYGDEKRELMRWTDVWHRSRRRKQSEESRVDARSSGEREGSPSNFTL